MDSGNISNDIVIGDDFTFNLRSERSETVSCKIYTIAYEATAVSGNTAMTSIQIVVPTTKNTDNPCNKNPD